MTENVLKPDKSDPAWSWMALSLISGIGYKKIRNLIEHIDSVENLLKTRPEILIEQFQISSKLADLISKGTQSHSFNIEKRIIEESPGVRLFCPDSSGYPLRLQQISTPPSVLYWQGDSMQKVPALLSSAPGVAQHMENNKRGDSLKKSHNMFRT